MNNIIKKQAGFTLIEILIVVILLGIMATIIIPQVSVNSEDAKENTLKTNLRHMRNAIDQYYYQHGNTYPGIHDEKGVPSSTEAQAEKGFLEQLTLYTDVSGHAYPMKVGLYGEIYKFGPYLKSNNLPMNPFNNNNDILCDITTTDITARTSDGSSGWKFYINTGVLLANDGEHDGL